MPPPNKVPRDKIRRLAAQGVTSRNIALRYGVSMASVLAAIKPAKREGGEGCSKK